MALVMHKGYKFADKVIADGKKGVIIGVNETEVSIQFVRGRLNLRWSEIYADPKRLKSAK